MSKSRTDIQQESDSKRGVTAKTYKLPKQLVDDIAQLAAQHGISQAQVLADAIYLLKLKSTQQ